MALAYEEVMLEESSKSKRYFATSPVTLADNVLQPVTSNSPQS